MSYTTTWEEITSHYRVKDREFPMLADDMPTFMGVPHATTPDDLAGADVVTLPFAVLKQMLHHPLTDKGLKKFLADWKAANRNFMTEEAEER